MSKYSDFWDAANKVTREGIIKLSDKRVDWRQVVDSEWIDLTELAQRKLTQTIKKWKAF